MRKLQITDIVALVGIFALCMDVSAAFGVRVGASFNVNADFSHGAVQNAGATDPGPDSAGADHFYDDGFNRVDSSGNFGGFTSFWGYDSSSQYDATGDGGNGTITMRSDSTTLDPGGFAESQDGALPTVELFWEDSFVERDSWTFGLSAGVRWQPVEIDGSARFGATTVQIADVYSLGGSIPPDPFEGTSDGFGYAFLDDLPDRTETTTTPTVDSKREIDGDLFSFNFGPKYAFELSEKWNAVLSAGATVAYMDSEFSYDDGPSGNASSSDSDWLLGAYAGIDLAYMIADDWAITFGAAYTYLEDFEQEVDDRKATVEFDESYQLRAGLAWQF